MRRADRLGTWCEAGRRRRPAFTPVPGNEHRYRRVAARLRHYVAGVGRQQSTLPLIERATRRHISGITGYAEWIDELRWSGLSARAGHTRLNQADAVERQRNLGDLYPRIDPRAAGDGKTTTASNC